MFVTTSVDALHLIRLIFDTPSHEGDERDWAEVQGRHGGGAAASPDRSVVVRTPEFGFLDFLELSISIAEVGRGGHLPPRPVCSSRLVPRGRWPVEGKSLLADENLQHVPPVRAFNRLNVCVGDQQRLTGESKSPGRVKEGA